MKEFASILKLPTKIIASLALASGAVLLLPQSVIDRLFLSNIKAEYGLYIGLTFIVSVSILTSTIVINITKIIKRKLLVRKRAKGRDEFLRNLDSEDKSLLREMLRSPNKTMDLPMHNGTVIKLRHADIICPAGSNHLVDPFEMRIPYFIQPWAVLEFNKNSDLLK